MMTQWSFFQQVSIHKDFGGRAVLHRDKASTIAPRRGQVVLRVRGVQEKAPCHLGVKSTKPEETGFK
eukprot:5763461-Pyramimonas_sp.AAC.1